MQLTELISLSGHEARCLLPPASLVLHETVETDLANTVKSASLLNKQTKKARGRKSSKKNIADVIAGQSLNCMI